MRTQLCLFTLLISLFGPAAGCFAATGDAKLKFYYENEPLQNVIEDYAKSTGQKFIVDSDLRGNLSIVVQSAISQEEAFNHLSSALALMSIGIVKSGDAYIVTHARAIERMGTEVTNEVPAVTPERLHTFVYTAKFQPARELNRNIRNWMSKDGELSVLENTNQLIFTDWTSNLQRIGGLLEKLDQPSSQKTAMVLKNQLKMMRGIPRYRMEGVQSK